MNLRPLFSTALITTLGVALAAPFVSKTNTYTITAPQGWTQRQVAGVEVAFLSPGATATSSANFNVVVNPAKGMKKIPNDATLKLLGDQFQSQLSTTLAGFKLVSRKNDTLSGQPAINMVFYGPNKLQFSQYLTVYGEKAYVITFVTQPGEYAKQLSTFTQIKNSFKFN